MNNNVNVKLNENVKVNEEKKEQKNNNNGLELEVRYKIDDNEIVLTPSIVQQYLVGDNAKLTPVEFKFFTELCKVRKLNPFLNEAYLIKYGTAPAQLVVGKDAILKRAILNPNFDGMESGVICYNENTGEEIERQGTYVPQGFKLVGGWAKVYVKNRKFPSYTSVNLVEAIQKKKSGEINSNWASKPATMIEKVAKVRALREAFVDDLGGMYDADEMAKEEVTKTHGSDKVVVEQEEIQEVQEANIESEEININEL